MKAITQDYKDNVKLLGREIDSIITYELDGQTIELGKEDLNHVNPHYETSLLKSAMKQLDIDSNVEIPLETVINYQFGVLVDDEYEYINYGNYVVYKVEKQEDLNSYKITCYDKMLYAMKPYENLGITYPISIRDYINAICNHLGLVFKNANTTFANYNRMIQSELYLYSDGASLGFTFRDVLDELAQVTGSVICINELTDELEVRYQNETNDVIDEEYLKDINVNFDSKKYGPVNSIVISRTAGEDNVYLRDEQSIAENGLCEIKIKDNQILNFNDRSDYLPDLFAALAGTEYYINDYSSTGITYYELLDKYKVKIGENLYDCLMLNDDVNVTQGLEEFVKTDIPEQGETDYSKADKTDRQMRQTYLIVDKQNQIIESVVSQVDGQNQKISQVTQTVDEINSRISDIADITISGESSYATFDLDNINQSEPIMVKVHATTQNISLLYPRSNLYPSGDLFMPIRKIRFRNKTTGEIFDYELPDDLLVYDNTHYDEFYLDYDSRTCQITKRCKYNADGSVSLLNTPVITDYPYPSIILTDGDYEISILGYNYGYLFTRLMTQNMYTTQFATKAELSSSITQTRESIDLSVNQKLSNYSTTNEMNAAINIKANEINQTVSQKVGVNEVISRINQTPETISINANKIKLEGYTTINNNFQIDTQGNMSCNNANITGTITGSSINGGSISGTSITSNTGKIAGFNLTSANLNNAINGIYNYDNYDLTSCVAFIMNYLTPNAQDKRVYDYDGDSIIGATDYVKIQNIINGSLTNTKNMTGTVYINSNNPKKSISVESNGLVTASMGVEGIDANMVTTTKAVVAPTNASTSTPMIMMDGPTATVTIGSINGNHTFITKDEVKTPKVTQTSLLEHKKNFERYYGALETIKDIDIYKYNLQDEKDDDKKHIGFVIGKDYKYSEEITSNDNTGVDIYSMTSLCLQAIKEQQEQIEVLKQEIKEIKNEKNNN